MNDPYGLMASGLPPELAAKLQGLTGQQAIAQMLMQQSMGGMQAPETKGRFQGRISPLEGVGKIAQALMAQKMRGESETGMADLANQRQGMVADAASKYQEMRSGATAQNIPYAAGLTSDEEGNAMPPAVKPAIQGDPRAAVAAAMTNPLLRNSPLVAADMKALEKQDEPYTLAPGAERRVGSTVVAKAAEKPQEHVINGKVYVKGPDGQMMPMGGPGDAMAYNRPFNADGTPNKEYQEYEKNKALLSATKVQTNVNSFTPASEEAQKKFMDSTRTTFDQLKHAPVALDSIDKAKALIPSAKGFMGPGGEGMLEAAKFLNNRLGMSIDTGGVKDAEELRTRIFFNIMDNLKKMDAQPSQMQQQIMADALGKLGTDPSALPQVLDAFSEVIRGKVDLHNKEVAGAAARGVKFPYDPTINLDGQKRRASDKNQTLRFDIKGNPIQ